MYDTLIVHGSFGSPFENWFPWLSQQLGTRGHRVLVPHFPGDELQNLDRWSGVLDSYRGCFSERLVIYGHSLAAAFLVDYFTAKKMPVAKAVFVAPFYGLIGIPEFDAVNCTFFADEALLTAFGERCDDVVCVFSDNDPYVPSSLSKKFAELTRAKVRLVAGGRHLNTEAGFVQFPALLEV